MVSEKGRLKTLAGRLALSAVQTVWEKFDVVQDDIFVIV